MGTESGAGAKYLVLLLYYSWNTWKIASFNTPLTPGNACVYSLIPVALVRAKKCPHESQLQALLQDHREHQIVSAQRSVSPRWIIDVHQSCLVDRRPLFCNAVCDEREKTTAPASQKQLTDRFFYSTTLAAAKLSLCVLDQSGHQTPELRAVCSLIKVE